MISQIANLITEDDISLLEQNENLSFPSNADSTRDRRLLLKDMTTIDVQACPGSGKTTLVAAKLLLLSNRWPFRFSGICVLSHTNVAKDEIIRIIEASKTLEGRKILQYPNFIGTIQDFAHRFIALPYLRSKGIVDFRIDNDIYAAQAIKLLQRDEFAWLRGTLKGLGSEDNVTTFFKSTFYSYEGNEININIIKIPKGWKTPSNLVKAKRFLIKLKQYLTTSGVFLYRDMYFFAEKALNENSSLPAVLQKRFPFILIDEMQDTQNFQDLLIQTIFPSVNTNISIQRFGDPDQAIFNGIGGEVPNESYNSKLHMNFVINQSNRFNDEIASKIRKLSFNEVRLSTELTTSRLEERKICHKGDGVFKHTIFVYNDTTIKNVIPKFAQLVSDQFNDEYKRSDRFKVKVVGAVGNEIGSENHLKIGNYWPTFDKKKAKSSFKATSLVNAAYYCRSQSSADWSEGYRFLNGYFISMLMDINYKNNDDRFFNSTTWKDYLKQKGLFRRYQNLIVLMLNRSADLNPDIWSEVPTFLKDALDIAKLPAEIKPYIEFDNQTISEADNIETTSLIQLENNLIKVVCGFKIEISTIHAVKGETHDATLVLETKNENCSDIFTMLPYLLDQCPNHERPNRLLRDKPHHAVADVTKMANKQFMRQLYVGMSRAKHLLCFSVHKDRLDPGTKDMLSTLGWYFDILEGTSAITILNS